MRIKHILVDGTKTLTGTNCSNCQYASGKSEKTAPGDLNKQGGTNPTNDKEMKMAEQADLITMPGTGKPEYKVMCTHSKVKQFVNERMCCAFWDAPGTLRAYGEQKIG